MKSLEYVLLHVLTNCPFAGNPLAVFPTSNELSTSDRQSIAREFNLSECAFASASETASNHWGLRIFKPAVEDAFKGHPTGAAALKPFTTAVGRASLRRGVWERTLAEAWAKGLDAQVRDGVAQAAELGGQAVFMGRGPCSAF
jgi:PhzF family phenazine biosynthesis protein